jgi:hypothetical protein
MNILLGLLRYAFLALLVVVLFYVISLIRRHLD